MSSSFSPPPPAEDSLATSNCTREHHFYHRATITCTYCRRRKVCNFTSQSDSDFLTLLHTPCLTPKCTNPNCWGLGLRILLEIKFEKLWIRCWACDTMWAIGDTWGAWVRDLEREWVCGKEECGWKIGSEGEWEWREERRWRWPREKREEEGTLWKLGRYEGGEVRF